MNRGAKNNPQYVCDKCGKEIENWHKNSKNYKIPHKYYKADRYGTPKKYIDLCDKCNEQLEQWLTIKNIPKLENLLERFEVYTDARISK